MDKEDVIDVLNDLIENCKDGEYGFLSSAEHVASPQLRSIFSARATSCRNAAAELESTIIQMGGKPEDDGSAAGAVHRGWVAVKGMLSGYSDLAMLEECERGEDAAVGRYRKALEKDLPPDVRALVQKQYEGAREAHDQIRYLREEARGAE